MSNNIQNNQVISNSNSKEFNDSHESINVKTFKIQNERIHYSMSLASTVETFYFIEQNVTNFLERFDNMCEKYEIKKLDKIRKLSWYCEKFIEEYIRMLSKYEKKDWTKICKIMRKKYENQNAD